MKEQIKQLKALKKKITSVWSLLKIDEMIAQMHGMEKEMQDPDFWNDQTNANRTYDCNTIALRTARHADDKRAKNKCNITCILNNITEPYYR